MAYIKYFWGFTFLILLISCKKEIPSITPQILDITESVYASGIIKSNNQYSVYATSSGIVTEIFVKVGDKIKKGDPLIKIQNQTALLNFENALLNAQYNDYNRNFEKVEQIRKEIEIAKLKVKSDSLLRKRQDNLWSQGIGTKVEQEQRVLA
ncbi:MAG: biotin/lipoyl-binding protein, partial [Saprospiraceae bacterium]